MTEGIVARGMSAGYHGVPAISDIDIEVSPGEVVALLGANGAGKTTTIKALSGQLKLIGGDVSVFGSTSWRPLHRRARGGLGLLTEKRCVFMDLTVRENLILGRGEAELALSYFPELEQRIDVRAGLLSGGEQQMLALARILAGKPRVLLADEVSLGLAPLIVARLLRALCEAAANGAAVLMVEQQARAALAAADRAYVLRRGRMVLEGNASELLQRPDAISDLYM